ncbi:hypothetical protein RSAG8_10402, partial [Rhizoctonia solani AG-8 WAC10335]
MRRRASIVEATGLREGTKRGPLRQRMSVLELRARSHRELVLGIGGPHADAIVWSLRGRHVGVLGPVVHAWLKRSRRVLARVLRQEGVHGGDRGGRNEEEVEIPEN